MSNQYEPNVYDPTHNVEDDMTNIETNFEALRTVFSSSSGPLQPVPYQLWADSLNHIIKVRDNTNNTWLNLFDVANNEVIISDTVRKGSIVEGEDIAPASCTLSCGGGAALGNMINFPIDYEGGATFLLSTSGKSTDTYHDFTGLDALIYAYDGYSARGRLHVSTPLGEQVSVRLKIGASLYSTESGLFSATGGVWSPEVTIGPIVGDGWQTMTWQVKWSIAGIPSTITVRGHNVNQL